MWGLRLLGDIKLDYPELLLCYFRLAFDKSIWKIFESVQKIHNMRRTKGEKVNKEDLE